MYQRILLPTDGSRLAEQAVRGGIEFARRVGAQVVGCYVVPIPHPELQDNLRARDPDLVDKQDAAMESLAEQYLGFIQATADAAGVPCRLSKSRGAVPATLIVQEAVRQGCDLIYMAAHGWNGGQGQLIGSVTDKVVHLSTIPVLVHKANFMIGHV